MPVKDIDKGYKAFKRLIGDLDGLRAEVGIRDGQIATYAAANEYGTDTIPSRPFMRSTIDGNRNKYSEQLTKLWNRASSGHFKGATAGGLLLRVGTTARNDLIKAISGWSQPRNADSTIAQKGENNPLVDTGAMQRAITVEVKK